MRNNQIRNRVGATLRNFAQLAWSVMTAISMAYVFGACLLSPVTPNLAGLEYLSYANAVGMALFVAAALGLAAGLLVSPTFLRSLSTASFKVVLSVVALGISAYSLYWSIGYLAANGLVFFDDAPYRFVVITVLGISNVLATLYVFAASVLRFKRLSPARYAAKLGASSLTVNVDASLQSLEATGWIARFNPRREIGLLAAIAGISRRRTNVKWVMATLGVSVCLSAAAIVLLIVLGSGFPATNETSATANAIGAVAALVWSCAYAASFVAAEFAACHFSVRATPALEKQQAAFGLLRSLYPRLYVVQAEGGRRGDYMVYSAQSKRPLVTLTFTSRGVIARSTQPDDYSTELNKMFNAPYSIDEKAGTVEFGRSDNLYWILLALVYSAYWAQVRGEVAG